VGAPGLQGYCMTAALGGEAEARRYTKICKKGRVPLIPAIPGVPTVPRNPGRMFSRRGAEMGERVWGYVVGWRAGAAVV